MRGNALNPGPVALLLSYHIPLELVRVGKGRVGWDSVICLKVLLVYQLLLRLRLEPRRTPYLNEGKKKTNPFYLWVHLEIGGVQQGWGGRLKVGFPSSGTCVQKWVG